MFKKIKKFLQIKKMKEFKMIKINIKDFYIRSNAKQINC